MNSDLAFIAEMCVDNLATQKAFPAHWKYFQIQNKWGNSWKKQQWAITSFYEVNE